MLDTDTRRRIDTARDILVGKVPDPKSQVEQITIALIYKFMDDMDAESEELGGLRKFFAGDFARYAWPRLIRSGLGGHETLNLYAESIARMPQNPGIPPLFRDIFKNAYLPYRDPETLRAFLKVIDEFTYDHSERLGDAFEYLLSVLSSQGDAGQFRTPRHIIDLIVAVVDPQKNESLLDPACGTAGFLISSYKHILRANSSPPSPSGRGAGGEGDLLTPDERGRLAANLRGYDISPDMVRLSLVNMYLHGFVDPHIYEYDTLTSLERWNEVADVILANPPFMSPKGGIRPHNRFSVQSKRSEVLFVDYMAEHLTPAGRAGIIVPEGIIFQSGTAYKKLREMLVAEYLVAVISLPAGVFNPYSGVKTSILLLDRSLARKTDTIAFFKVENDGYGLGAQRRPVEQNDLPLVRAQIAEYQRRLRAGESVMGEGFRPTLGLVVDKDRIAANGEYNLSGERYREEKDRRKQSWPMVSLSDVCSLQRGLSYSSTEIGDENNGVPFYNLKSIKRQGIVQNNDFKHFTGEIKERYYVQPGDVLVALTDLTPTSELIGSPKLVTDAIKAAYSADLGKLVFKDVRVQPQFVYHLLRSSHYRSYIVTYSHGANVKHLQTDGFYSFQIPLPPLDVQQEIVAEIEGYQRVIDGARAVLDSYRPHISIDPAWPMVEIEKLVADEPHSIKAGPFGSALKKEFYVPTGYKIYGQEQVIRGDAKYGDYYISEEKYRELESCRVQAGDVLISLVGTYGKTLIIPNEYQPGIINPRLLKLTLNREKMLPTFFVAVFAQDYVMSQVHAMSYGGTMNILSLKVLRSLRLPLPPLATQQAIVAEIEAEQALVAANRELIARFEQKIQATLARIWGEEA